MMRVCVLVWACVCVCSALICPDGGMCGDGDTCCKTPSGGYGCCPLPNAECCSDHLHCCFEGTLCDLVHSKCINKTLSLPLVKKLPAKRVNLPKTVERVEAVVCPDGASECPDDTTCCELPDGNWGCCPMAKAVCCDDKQHCCPEGTVCDVQHSRCVSRSLTHTPLLLKLPARRTATLDRANAQREKPGPVPNDVICPDKMSSCPDDTTCCSLTNGSYGCCPMPKAVCCSDHLHCCPEGTSCDLAHSTCNGANGRTGWAMKIPALTLSKAKETSVPCNESVACADGNTCCKTAGGTWACCPLPKAVCCEDHLHCCPHDTVCNLAASTCDSAQGVVPMLRKEPAVSRAERVQLQDEQCDDATRCPAGSSCCRRSSGTWACCPLPKAVCCEDHEHCCPSGYKCDVAQKTCQRSGLPSMPWSRKLPAIRAPPRPDASANNNVDADVGPRHMCDTQASCPRDNTCCYIKDLHKWGCCPLPQAVCCRDGANCCPKDYTCVEEKKTCRRGHHQVPMVTKQEARVTPVAGVNGEVGDIKCDPTSSCAAGSTCCKLPTGQWGCCPLVKAVCCEDHEHCCPQGYSCDLQSGTCIKPSVGHALPLSRVSATARTHTPAPSSSADTPCDSLTQCPATQTCCRAADNSWACCPYQQAVCCEDLHHCCPMGYTCDPQVKGCTRVPGLNLWNNL